MLDLLTVGRFGASRGKNVQMNNHGRFALGPPA